MDWGDSELISKVGLCTIKRWEQKEVPGINWCVCDGLKNQKIQMTLVLKGP